MLEGHHTFTKHRKASGRWSPSKPTLTTPAGRPAPCGWQTREGVVLFSHRTCAQSRPPRRHRNIIQVHAFQPRLCHGAVTTQARQTTSVLGASRTPAASPKRVKAVQCYPILFGYPSAVLLLLLLLWLSSACCRAAGCEVPAEGQKQCIRQLQRIAGNVRDS